MWTLLLLKKAIKEIENTVVVVVCAGNVDCGTRRFRLNEMREGVI
jgi:hypothetical protein